MAGNDGRHGAVRRPGSKKRPTKGTGGHSRKALEGKGPTPKAEDRVYHRAYRAKKAAEKRATHEAGVAQRAAARDQYRPHVRAGNEVVVGRNPVLEAVRAGLPIRRVFMAGALVSDERLSKVVQSATASGVPLIECTRSDLDRMAEGANHQGVIIEVAPYEYADVWDLWQAATSEARRAAGHLPLFIALDQVTDPHNLGAVLRSGAAFGADGVIIPEHRSAPVNSAAWKVSAGAAAIVPVAQATNLVRTLEELKQRGAFVIGLDGGGDVELPALQLTDVPLVVVTGAEGSGLSRLVRQSCDQIVSIPIDARMESLNAAVATGIALYQVSVARGK